MSATATLPIRRLAPTSARHVLVTGSSTGIGRACALHLARSGYLVWAGVRKPEDAESIEIDGIKTPHGIRPLMLDVTKADSISAAGDEIRAVAGENGLHGIVNNAGICIVGPVETLSLNSWRQQFEVNLFGAIAVTQTMLPLLRQHNATSTGGARIVNVGSITGEISTPLFGAYSASKFAMRAMNDALRIELGPEGIHVSLLVPGTIQSDIWRKEKQGVEDFVPGSAARRQYGAVIDSVAGYVFKCAKKAIPAQRVADAVYDCFSSSSPRMEYKVGWEAHVGSPAKKLMPSWLFDYLLRRTLKIPTKSRDI